VLFGRDFWNRLLDFQFLIDEGTISPEDVSLFRYCETADEAWDFIREFHKLAELAPGESGEEMIGS
jgi:predicted Rossmann-fold nucleotide-binding protein